MDFLGARKRIIHRREILKKEKLGFTQKEVAKNIFGVRRQTFCAWETGSAPPDHKHRTKFIEYIWHILGFKEQRQVCQDIVSTLFEEWNWPAFDLNKQFVGRGEELKEITKKWREAEPGHPELVFIEGASGVGKTHFCEELRNIICTEDEEVDIAIAKCQSDSGRIYEPIVRWLTSTEIKHRVDRISLESKEYLARISPFSDGYSSDLGPPQSHKNDGSDRLCEIVKEVLAAESKDYILVIEDLQWAGLDTIRLLSNFFSQPSPQLNQTKVMFVANMRPDISKEQKENIERLQSKLAHDNRLLSLELDTFTLEETTQLFFQKLKAEVSLELITYVHEFYDGLPFDIGEALRICEEQWIFDQTAPGSRQKLQELINEHLLNNLNLSPEAEKVSQIAAVYNEDFDEEFLCKAGNILGLDEDGFERGLEELVDKKIIIELPEDKYQFRHDLHRKSVYENARLRATKRKNLHARIGELLENRYGAERQASNASIIAWHYAKGKQYRDAVRFYQIAADYALIYFSFEMQIAHLRAARKLSEEIDFDEWNIKQKIKIHDALIYALIATEGYGFSEVNDHCSKALRLYRELYGEDVPAEAYCRLLTAQAPHYMIRARYTDTDEMAAQLLGYATELSNSDNQLGEAYRVLAYFILGVSAFHTGRFDEARKHLEADITNYKNISKSLESIPHLRHPVINPINRHGYYGALLWFVGEPEKAIRITQEAVDDAVYMKQGPYVITMAMFTQVWVHYMCGDWIKVESVCHEALKILEQSKLRLWEGVHKLFLGSALTKQGKPEDGLKYFNEGKELYLSTEASIAMPMWYCYAAEIFLDLEHIEPALKHLESAEKATMAKADSYEPYSQGCQRREASFDSTMSRLKGVATNMNGDIREAASCFDKALNIAQEQNTAALALRAATSLAQFRIERYPENQPKLEDARQKLQNALSQIVRGRDTMDNIKANKCLEELDDLLA